MALTLHADPAHADVTLDVTGAADGPVVVTRTDRNGSATVRQRDGQVAIGGSLHLVDYEVALTGPVSYTAVDSAGTSSSAAVPAGLDATTPWLSHPGLPALNIPVTVQTDDWTRARKSVRHDVYGRADPIMVTQPMSYPTGTLIFRVYSWEQVAPIEAVYDSGVPVLIRYPCATDRDHYHVGDITQAPATESDWDGHFLVTIAYVDTASPRGNLMGSLTWTYADGTALTSSYAADKVRFPTYAERIAGPVPT